MKKVLFTLYKNKSHSLYKQFINDPPAGYQYFTLDDFFEEFILEKSSNIFFEIIVKIKRNQKIINIAKKNKIDIIYCCDGMLLFNSSIPWILELEHATSLIAHNFGLWKIAKYILPSILKQKSLKYLIPWTEAGALSLEKNLKIGEELSRKIRPVHLCRNQIDDFNIIENRKIRHEKFAMLFVTSLNYNNEGEFYSKGGRIIVEVFKELRKDRDIKLILRSKVPTEFSYLKNDPQVEIYEDVLSPEKFQEIFLKSDMFLFPGYQSPGMAFLDAMNYNLPIFTTNIFANQEMVRDEVSGYLVGISKNVSVYHLYDEYGLRVIPSGAKAMEDQDLDEIVNMICGKIKLLYENRKILSEMGKESKKLLNSEFSLRKRNEKLKDIYDKI
jgi:glycosyltransferase involved in cell wall biosynthesis